MFWATFCQKVGCYGVDFGDVVRSAIDPVYHFIEDKAGAFKGS
ncbi:hypothetical protein Nizo1838_1284 [Lactiplantibacillus plantarum]|nr:hypothetical protein Nizo1838_1284 [Lactiplantibacillus plantarum]KZT89127.1 hypothetical protein Nizo2256_1607 [Lactiplantibacillus plantarum]